MRRMVCLALGFAAACGLMLYLDSWLVRLPGMIAVILFGMFGQKEPGILKRAILTLLGCVLGIAWFCGYTWRNLSPITALDGEVVSCSIRAADYSRETDYGIALDGTAELAGKTYRVTAYLDAMEPFVPGDGVTGEFRLRVTTDAGENPSAYYPGKGIFLLAYQTDTITRFQTPQTWRDSPAKLRRQISEILHCCIPQDCVPFAKALLLGDTSELSYQTDTNLKVSGIRHVVAVSGLHISILFALISTVTFRRRFLTALTGIPLLFLFAAVAGFTPSVCRACVMMGLMMLAQTMDREYDAPTALSFAVLVMLLANPYCISSVSFQLSVASVAGILLFSPGIRSRLVSGLGARKGKWSALLGKLATGVSVTLGAQVLTVPLCAYYFGVVSLVGFLTNLLVLWVVSLIFLGLAAVCLLALISMTLSAMVGTVLAVLIRYVLLVAKVLAAFPLAAVYTVSPYITAWLIFAYALLLLFLISGKQIPKVFACCAVLGLCLSLTASWWEPAVSDVTFTVLDVGQGQCLLLQSQGRTYMVDCGGDSDTRTADIAAEALLSRGISRVDALILTHLDRDHAGAAENFLSRLPTDLLILPWCSADLSVPADTQIVCAECDLQISDENTVLSVFAPVFQGSGNEMSLCVLFETEKCDILITGDRDGFGERSLLRHAALPDVDILVAGHHGSQTSTCVELLQAVKPEIVCISAGAENPYGHPAPELLERLSDYGCTVFRTDQQGTITIRR